MSLYSLCMLLTTTIYHNNGDSLGLNEDCPRIRRSWHELSAVERDLYISGLLQLRTNGDGDITKDELIAIASVHEDEFAPITHKSSSYLYWHGYLLWELETRIRNLGGKYSCFGMPYWDFTMEHDRESNPSVFNTGLGADGNPNDWYTVNQYSWNDITTKDYWVPFNCFAENDEYPICSLKRALKPNFEMPSTEELGAGIIRNPEFTQFAKWYATSYNPTHLFTAADFLNQPGGDETPVVTSYDPIWYLFHSMVQYHQAIWTDCNEYDLIDPADLDNHPEAYTPFCVHGECVTPDHYPEEWMRMGLDDVMHFGGSLQEKEWSYINKNGLTVRELYDLPSWGIVYDLGKGQGFYEKSGLKEYCSGKLNKEWFMLNEKDGDEEILSSKSYSSTLSYIPSYHSVFILVLIISIGYGSWYLCNKEKTMINNEVYYSYGTV